MVILKGWRTATQVGYLAALNLLREILYLVKSEREWQRPATWQAWSPATLPSLHLSFLLPCVIFLLPLICIRVAHGYSQPRLMRVCIYGWVCVCRKWTWQLLPRLQNKREMDREERGSGRWGGGGCIKAHPDPIYARECFSKKKRRTHRYLDCKKGLMCKVPNVWVHHWIVFYSWLRATKGLMVLLQDYAVWLHLWPKSRCIMQH